MNKNEYLYQLRKEMDGMSSSDIEDIIRDQEEYFRDALQSGRDEVQVVNSLGDPAQLAKELRAEIQIKAATAEDKFLPKVKSIFKAILALCVLAPFNLIFVLGPFLFCCGIILAFWAAGVAFTVAAFVVMVVAFIAGFIVNPIFGLMIFFAGIGLLGASILFLCAAFFVTRWFLKLTISFLKWNIHFITNQTK